MSLPKSAALLLIVVLLLAACAPLQAASPTAAPTTPPAAPTVPPPPTQPATAQPTSLPSPSPAATGSSLAIEVSPAEAAPGETVTLSGVLPGGPTQAQAQDNQAILHANVCWMGCLSGLVIQGQAVEWSATEPGKFSLSFTVPTTPWLGADGPHPLTAGDYQVGVQCLGPDLQGCAQREAQATAQLHLTKDSATTCPNAGCAALSLSPAQGNPGTVVQVQGWAPLDEVIGTLAFGYSLVLLTPNNPSQPVEIGSLDQQLDGSLSGSFQVPQSIPGQGELKPGGYQIALQAARLASTNPIRLAATPFQVGAAQGWRGLSLPRPLDIQPAGSLERSEVAVDPANPARLAACAPGGVNLSTDSGKTWTLVPTAGVEQAAAQTGYPLFMPDTGAPACLAVTLDPAHPQSFYAVFRTMKQDVGAPPVFFMGFVTSDLGKTWTALKPPTTTQAETFGGFWETPTAVQALYTPAEAQSGAAGAPDVLQTADGGKTWAAASLTCPVEGPCLRWGPVPGAITGMGAQAPEAVLRSPDGGKTWASTGQSVELRIPGPNELVAYSATTALQISGGADYPVLLTQDGGQTWQALSLPALPNAVGPAFPGLQVLPDGSLIAQPEQDQPWMRLAPGAAAWCSMGSANLPKTGPALILASGDTLWWAPLLDQATAETAKPQSQPLSGLKCSP